MKFHAGRYIDDFVNKTSRDKGGSVCKQQAETVQSNIVGYTPRSKLPFRGIHFPFTQFMFTVCVKVAGVL